MKSGLPWLLARTVRAAEGVDVHAEVEQQRHGRGPAAARGPDDQPGPLSQLGDRGRGKRQRPGPIAGHDGGQQSVDTLEVGRCGAAADQVGHDVRVSAQRRHLDRRVPVPVGGVNVDAMLGQQAHPGELVMRDRPVQLAAQHLGGCSELVAEPRLPRTAIAVAKAVFEQQLEMVVVGLEHAVVERLAVVGVGARIEQHAREHRRARTPLSAG